MAVVDIFRILLLFLSARFNHAGSFVPSATKQVKECKNNCMERCSSLNLQMRSEALATDPQSMHHAENKHSGITFSRRSCLAIFSGCVAMCNVPQVYAEEGGSGYNNPNIPPGPEEKSGLVVLRVAEVANFQEKILRAVAKGDLDYAVSPQQIAFGTQILLKNSNLDGNMKLMIYNEVPRERRDEAIKNAVKSMNGLQTILSEATNTQRPFEVEDMLHFADMYRDVRLNLNNMYECLPPKEKSKYYGYFMAVTEYEKKIAEGTYNPDTDGLLKLDYD